MGLREEVDEIKEALSKGGVDFGKQGGDLHNKAMKEVIARLDSIEEVIKTLAERLDAMDLEPEDDDLAFIDELAERSDDDPDGEEG